MSDSRGRDAYTWAAFLVILALVSVPVSVMAQSSSGNVSELVRRITGGDESASLDEIDVVRAIYDEAQRILQGSGYEPAIDLWDFRTIEAPDFGRYAIVSVVTPPGGRTLRLERDYMSYNDDHRWVHLGATWEGPESVAPLAKRSARATLVDAAEILDDPGFHKEFGAAPAADTIAVTAYQVRLEAEGESRSYRAAVFWRQQADGVIVASIQDNVLTPLDFVLAEDAEPTPHADFQSLLASVDLGPAAGAVPTLKAGCLATSNTDLQPGQTDSSGFGHTTGNHFAILRLQASHACTSGCQATCAPSFHSKGCGGYGRLPFGVSHKLSVARRQRGQSAPLSATCVGGQQCLVGECILGVCPGLSPSVNIQGTSVSFGNSSGAIDSFEMEESSTRGCLVIPDPPPPPPLPCQESRGVIGQISIEDDAPVLPMPKGGFTLRRHEASDVMHGDSSVDYLMGEWALVSYSSFPKAGPRVDVLDASDGSFADAKASDLSRLLLQPQNKALAGPSAHSAVIVEMPGHGDNSRTIPMPALELGGGPVPPGLAPGRVLVRADFSDDRKLQDLRVLQDTFGGRIDGALIDTLSDQLQLEYLTESNHRVVVFAVIDIAEGALNLQRSLPYMPKCCCGAEFCI